MSTISVVLITYNEERKIKACLESVKWADEIIIIDSNSTDKTLEIAKQYTSKVQITKSWPGFGVQKNRALKKAQSDWLLALDADEVITPELKAEIQSIINDNNALDAYFIPRKTTYCGYLIQHGDWRNDKVLRLLKNGVGEYNDAKIHERIILNEGTRQGRLNNAMLHYSFETLDDVLNKINRYSTDGAQMQFEKGKKATLGKAIAHGLWTFLRGYFFRLGFLDGKAGFLLAFGNALGCFYRYAKLSYLSNSAN